MKSYNVEKMTDAEIKHYRKIQAEWKISHPVECLQTNEEL